MKSKTKISILAVVLIMATQVLHAQWETTGNIVGFTDWFGAQINSTAPVRFEHRANDPASRFEWYTHDGTSLADRMHLTRLGWLGLNTDDPEMMFHVLNGGILSSGTTGTTPDLNAGTRLMWIPDRFAFRAGRVGDSVGDPDWWNGVNIGQGSVAFGSDNLVSGDYSVAFADGNEVTGPRSIAFGSTNTISAGNAIGFGTSNAITGTSGVAIGLRNIVNGQQGVALGRFLEAGVLNTMVFGHGIDEDNLLLNNIENSLMVGFNSTVSTLFVGPPEDEEVIGSVGIGDITAPTERLDVRGTARLREMETAEAPHVIVVGEEADEEEGDYVLRYLEFTGNGTDLLAGDGTWVDGSANLCDWNIVNAGQDLATGYPGACVEGNVGIGIQPSDHVKLEVSSELTVGDACGIRVRTSAFADTTFGVFSFIVDANQNAESVRAFFGEARGSHAPFGGHFTAHGIDILLEQPPVGAYGRAEYAGSTVNNDNLPIGVYGLATTDLECQRTIGVYGGFNAPDCNDLEIGVAGYFAGAMVELQTPLVVSDQAIKTNVADVGNSLELLSQLSPKSYNFTQNTEYGNVFSKGLSYGFLAQEVEQVIPELVASVPAPIKVTDDGRIQSTGDDLLGIKYTELIPLLVAGIQEQQSQIETQDAEIAELQDLVSSQTSLLMQVQEQMQMLQQQIDGCCMDQGWVPKSSEMGQQDPMGKNELYQNTPNPFRNHTTIRYTLEQGGRVMLKIHDGNGREVAQLENAEQSAGTYTYVWDATGLPAGLYHYTLFVDDELLVKRAIKL